MKKLMAIAAVLTMSSTVFADAKDLKTFNSLQKIGASSLQFMSQIHVGIDDIECASSNQSKSYDCNMTDIYANEGVGGTLQLTGEAAKYVYDLLVAAGAPSDNGMGKTFVSAHSLRCSQAVEGVADGSESDRTSCLIELTEVQ